MSSQESGVPGGYGARKGGTSGGGRVIEPYVPPTTSSDDGTYTDASGKPITREQAMTSGGIDKPGEASTKLAQAGAPSGGYVSPKPIGLEALKQAELQASRADVARRQSEQGTTASEAFAIQRMLRSPTAQFSSQESAQRGYELASRYDRSFSPEQVKATLAPKYQPTPLPSISQHLPIPKVTFSAGKQAGRPTETEFEKRRAGFYTYGAYRKLENVSKGLQAGFERVLGYDERSSIPIKAIAGFGSVFTGLPAFAGQVAGASEAIVRYPVESIRGLPTGFKILSSQITEQATSKPVEFGGSLVGMAAIGRYAPKISLPTKANLKVFARSESAILAPRRATYEPGSVDFKKALERGERLKGTFTGSIEGFGSKGYKPISFKPIPETMPTIIPKISEPLEMVKLKLQPTPTQPKLRPVMELEKPVVLKGLEQGILTKTEFMTTQKTGLRRTPLSELKPFEELKITPKSRITLYPYAQMPQPKPSNILKTRTITETKPRIAIQQQQLTKLRLKQKTMILPKTKTMTSTQLQTQLKVKPITETRTQVKTQTQLQTKTLTQLRTKLKTNILEKQRSKTSTPSILSRRSSILSGSRKFTTSLGGKTIKQLEVELKRKRKL